MRGTEAGFDSRLETRLDALEQRERGWRPWLALLREAFHGLEDGVWSEVAGRRRGAAGGESDGTPLLHGQELSVDVERVGAFLSRLAALVDLGSYRPSSEETLRLVTHAVQHERAAIAALAVAAELDGAALGQVAQLGVFPLLVACSRALADAIPRVWAHGHCPVCGAWALFAEQRGLERARRLRCGCCAADWPIPSVTCVYCGERDHARLGSLVPEGKLEARRIDTCTTCRGYLKSIATLGALSPADVLLTDLETLELDLVARDRGWERPSRPAWTLEVRVRARS